MKNKRVVFDVGEEVAGKGQLPLLSRCGTSAKLCRPLDAGRTFPDAAK